MEFLDYRIVLPSPSTPFHLIGIACVHADDPGFRRGLFLQCLKEIRETPHCYAICLGDMRNFLRTHARTWLKQYPHDTDSFRDLDSMVWKGANEFYQEYLKPIEHKLIGMSEGNHYHEFCATAKNRYTSGETDTQLMCRLAGVPYLGKAAYIRLSVSAGKDTSAMGVLKILIHHGDWSGGYQRPGGDLNALELKGLGFDADVYMAAHCFDEQTEILTPTGWRAHQQVHPGDSVGTYNRVTDRIEWQPVEEVVRYNHYNELIHAKSHLVDVCVTPEHGLWAGSYQWKYPTPSKWWRSHGERWTWGESTAIERFGHLTGFLLAAKLDGGGIALSDAWIRVLAWIMAEGCISRKKGGALGYVRIAQSDAPDGRLHRLIRDLDEAGIPFTKSLRYGANTTVHGVHRNFDAYGFNLREPRKWFETLLAYLGWTKTPTDLLSGMSSRQIEVFLETYIIADGCKNKAATTSYQIASKRKDHIDWLQMMACLAGYRTSICGGQNGKVYYLTMNRQRIAGVKPHSWKRVPYTGVVWCVRVKNGTVVVRRGGHTTITLNTHRKLAYLSPLLTIPTRGELRTIERPRAFIKAGCFVASYDKCIPTNYAQRKLMHPTELGYVVLTVKFHQDYNAERYRRARLEGKDWKSASRVSNYRPKFSIRI